MDKEDLNNDVIDEDLYEEIDDEELYELVEEERQKALERAAMEKISGKPKRPFPKWTFWLIAIAMFINVIAVLPQTFSIPAIDFLITSAKLSTQEDIQEYKKAVVVVETGESKGTGFSISSDGVIITNDHVVDEHETLTIAFPDEGLFSAEVMESYPEVDLAVLKVDGGEGLPYLDLAAEAKFKTDEEISFIGNPLAFNGIANEGTIIDYTQLSDWDEPVLMLHAPVYRGNSGSPVINEDGNVIGVVFATLKDDTHGKVGLFVPIDYFHNRYPSS
ncbi:Trypsin-like peptidase domain-containing protein [Oceanobacillus limi]|uniref:Trypsin-like peptidase domain-containing protein n=1 Tax=Oceanobacillus limi TaxID=930131 RepID=A0A1H9YHG3_9BACI|nr:serine protease [Oceanobacillus limi]SES68416.1 Trypsin-like peptidase domain-containing protein [Oceanobacillus limi]